MKRRLSKLNAIRARWELRLKALRAQLEIAQQTLADLQTRRSQLEQLRLDYRHQRQAKQLRSAHSLQLLARFDMEISHSLDKVILQIKDAEPLLAQRQQAVLNGERRLLGLRRYQERLSEDYHISQRQLIRRRQNQLSWRTRKHTESQ